MQSAYSIFSAAATTLSESLDEPVYLFGNSMGGAFSIYWAEQAPQFFLGVGLLSPGGAPMAAPELEEFRKIFALNSFKDARVFAGKLARKIPAPVAWALSPLLRYSFRDPLVKKILAAIQPNEGVQPEQLAKLTMPLMFIWGKAERVLPDAHFHYYAANLPPHAVVLRPEKFGHCPQMDQPAALAQQIIQFAAGIEHGTHGSHGAHRADEKAKKLAKSASVRQVS
jgi:pimeloyl-ACP methyl ester carboxylesterase